MKSSWIRKGIVFVTMALAMDLSAGYWKEGLSAPVKERATKEKAKLHKKKHHKAARSEESPHKKAADSTAVEEKAVKKEGAKKHKKHHRGQSATVHKKREKHPSAPIKAIRKRSLPPPEKQNLPDEGDSNAPSKDNPEQPTPAVDVNKGTVTGLPLPRFASLRADEVNWRVGPGSRYPIQWVYHRRGMPVRILREFDVWRLIEDAEGQKGWVHQATLVGRRSFIIPGEKFSSDLSLAAPASSENKANTLSGQTDAQLVGYVSDMASIQKDKEGVVMYAQADEHSTPVAVLKPGTTGVLEHCATGSAWCQVKVKQHEGWLPRSAFWGISADETLP
ncbi:SH3 domain-containing protein [Entomobacter blattae]|uniref:Bacterial SH3 domain protein n=1 Tax=Entomobacter blattae TaxID=2762277 RepID=A0A7H1NPF8_9PROT|nr:SH3 domain-containing protein [Entomobacter blattae]QNT77668.1 Bacterial SH3 domain protein [Entomobacter blattae]